MKLMLFSDMHLRMTIPAARVDNAVLAQADKFIYAMKFYKDNNIDAILQAGDMFDSPRSWRALSFYSKILQHFQPNFYCVAGQHDTYMYSEGTRDTTSMGVLHGVGLVNVLGPDPTLLENTVALYGCSYGQPVPTPSRVSGVKNILVIHAKIARSLPFELPGMVYASKFLEENPGYDIVICGDIHDKFTVKYEKSVICNTGPLLRDAATRDMFDHHPGFFIYDTKTGKMRWETIPHAEADRVLTREHIKQVEHREEVLDSFIEQLNLYPERASESDDLFSYKDNLLLFIRENYIEPAVVNLISETMGEQDANR